MIYYDKKIASLESLQDELKSLLERANANLSPQQIQNALNASFESLRAQNQSALALYTQELEKNAQTAIKNAQNELENSAQSYIESFVKDALSSQRLQDLVDTPALLKSIEQSFLNAHSSDMLEKTSFEIVKNNSQNITQSVKSEILNQKGEQISQNTANELIKLLQPLVRERIEASISQFLKDSKDYDVIAQSLLTQKSAREWLSSAISTKLVYDTHFKDLLYKTCKRVFEQNAQERIVYLQDLLKKTQIYASQNMLCVSNAINIIYSREFRDLELEFEQILEQKRQDFLKALQTPKQEEIKNNIFVVR